MHNPGRMASIQNVVILCGGRGTRLQEHTQSIPKPLVEIGGRPILWHVMRIYAAQGLTRFLLAIPWVVHTMPERDGSPRARFRGVLELPGRLAIDATEIAALAWGSVKNRTILL